MTPTVATAEPTLLEKLHALEVTARQLVTERDCAFKMAGHTTRELARAHDELKGLKAQLPLRDNLIESLRIDRDTKANSNRRLTARVRELALANEDLQRQLDATRQQPEASAPRRKRKWRFRRR